MRPDVAKSTPHGSRSGNRNERSLAVISVKASLSSAIVPASAFGENAQLTDEIEIPRPSVNLFFGRVFTQNIATSYSIKNTAKYLRCESFKEAYQREKIDNERLRCIHFEECTWS